MTEVLIAGAGPTGLTLACELAVRGIEVRIVDRAAEFFGGSRADGIQPRTMEVFADLGVLDRIVAAGDLGILMRAYQGETVVWEGKMTEAEEPTSDVPYPNAWFVPQFRTEEILRERLAELGVRVELSTALVDFTQDDDGVTAVLAAADGRTAQERVRYLVGADGGRSTVRKTLGIDFPGETDDSTTMLFADVRVEGIGRDHGRIWRVGEGGVGLTPLAGTDLFVAVARPPSNADEPVLDYLQRTVQEASGRSDIVVREVTWHTTWRENTRLATRFRDGRVFLVGDAGHVHPPTGGQGMNTGIQDGYNLGWKLAAALAGGRDVLLDSFEPERMAAARKALDIAKNLLEKHRRGDEDAHVRGPELRGFALNYRGGPLSADDRPTPGAVQAGDRAPDAAGRLFPLFRGPHWTLLAFGAGQAGTVAAVNESFGGTVHAYAVADTDGDAWANYDVTDGTLVLVRPDGYVGLVTTSAERITEYWTALHGAASPSLAFRA
ncbi:2-polyprenyl-6-methoxyphenol hydroxylase [Asanoa hainanensis]|uniref:2-polyprenyl-6-methoxyphenol hydroxylase n=1 Tax=Asanoa hainanensis TaxID=560556 RepID=A0A239PFB9_9ACTN|nr:FAD-dependent monooxygenase [Asanoa hainanensis]SNT65796.1 2-polyprenyl-6-methoxyphenol hydroxylase [Asanoa hainanensis]